MAAIAREARRRARRRRRARIAAPAAVLGAAGLVAAARAAAGPGGGPDRATVGTASTRSSPRLDLPDPWPFAHLLATRGWLSTAKLVSWPVTPDDFFGRRPPDLVVVGRLEAIRPGPSTTGTCIDEPQLAGCFVTRHLDMVVRVDESLGPARLTDSTVTVSWSLGDEIRAAGQVEGPGPDIRAYQRCIPAGARVIVFLRSTGARAEHPRWAAVEPSGIVFQAPDGVVVPHPDPAVAHRPETFARYLAQVAALAGR